MTQQKQFTDKEVLNKVFRDLRKAGFKARQGYKCCQNCGWSAMEMEYKATKDTPAVFYHAQDKEDSFDGLTLVKKLYLAWQGDGQKIQSIIESHGLKVDWDGDGGTRIAILPRAWN